jgi:hypothetical protein
MKKAQSIPFGKVKKIIWNGPAVPLKPHPGLLRREARYEPVPKSWPGSAGGRGGLRRSPAPAWSEC